MRINEMLADGTHVGHQKFRLSDLKSDVEPSGVSKLFFIIIDR